MPAPHLWSWPPHPGPCGGAHMAAFATPLMDELLARLAAATTRGGVLVDAAQRSPLNPRTLRAQRMPLIPVATPTRPPASEKEADEAYAADSEEELLPTSQGLSPTAGLIHSLKRLTAAPASSEEQPLCRTAHPQSHRSVRVMRKRKDVRKAVREGLGFLA